VKIRASLKVIKFHTCTKQRVKLNTYDKLDVFVRHRVVVLIIIIIIELSDCFSTELLSTLEVKQFKLNSDEELIKRNVALFSVFMLTGV